MLQKSLLSGMTAIRAIMADLPIPMSSAIAPSPILEAVRRMHKRYEELTALCHGDAAKGIVGWEDY